MASWEIYEFPSFSMEKKFMTIKKQILQPWMTPEGLTPSSHGFLQHLRESLRINTFPLLHFPVAAKLPEMHGPGLRRRAAQVFELGHSCFPPNGLYIFYTSYYLINLSNSSNGLYTSISMRDLPLD